MNGADTNIVGISYQTLATARMAQVRAAMDAVIGAEVRFVVPTLQALLVLFVVRQFMLFVSGDMALGRLGASVFRALVVVLLVAHAGQFTQRVRDPVFDTIPQAIASTVNGAGGATTTSTMSIAEQFDRVSMAAEAVTALTVSRLTMFSPASIANYTAANLANGAIQIMLAIVCAVWLLGVTLLAIILCFGPYVLLFELFDRTRGWVDQWLGKLVGLTCFGLGCSILLAIQMQGLLQVLRAVHDALPSSGPAAVATLMRVAGNTVMDALSMAALPFICAIGSGVAASLAAPVVLPALRSIPAAARAATRGR